MHNHMKLIGDAVRRAVRYAERNQPLHVERGERRCIQCGFPLVRGTASAVICPQCAATVAPNVAQPGEDAGRIISRRHFLMGAASVAAVVAGVGALIKPEPLQFKVAERFAFGWMDTRVMGAEYARALAEEITSVQPVRWTFENDPDRGIYRVSTNEILLAIAA